MSNELILLRGNAAEGLLDNEAFAIVVNALYSQYTDEITGSALGETALREQRFFQLRALQDITAELKGWISTRDQLLLSQTEE